MLVGGTGSTGYKTGGSFSGGGSSTGRIKKLEQDMERVLMITEALWKMLKEEHGYSDKELFKRVTEIDMRDGRLDGRVAPDGPELCPHCQRTMMGSKPICLYCGKPSVRDLFDR